MGFYKPTYQWGPHFVTEVGRFVMKDRATLAETASLSADEWNITDLRFNYISNKFIHFQDL